MKKTLTSVLGLFLIAGMAIGQTQSDLQTSATIPTAEIPVDPDVKIGTLSNGLKYYIKNNGKPEDKVELRLVVNAGSILESDRQVGLAHFMEHMNFNGTKNFQKNDLVDYLQSIGVKFGADLNAYTSFDETVYILPIPSDDPEKLEKGFQIIEDWAHNTTLSEEAIDGERGVVLEEYRLGLGANKRMMMETLPKMMYGSKYADRLPIGTKENLENFTYEDVRNYYKDWYRPDLMAVVAVGDLDVATLEAKIKDHFGSIPAAASDAKERKTFDLPNHEETFVAIASDREAPFSQVQVMYKDRNEAPVMKTTTDYRESVVRRLFSTMLNNRLNELRNSAKPPFVFGVSYYGGTFARNKNAFQSIANTAPDGQLKALEALLTENERVKQHGFTAGELDRAKLSLMAQVEKQYNDRDKSESGRIIGEYVNNFLDQEPIPGITWEYELTQKVLPTIQLPEVNDLINNFIHDDNRVIVFTGPEKEGLVQVKEQEVLDLLKEIETATITAYEDESVRENLIENLPEPGSIVAASADQLLETVTFTLSNGAKVTYKKTDFKNDEILFQATSPGGMSLYSDDEYKATIFANDGLSQAGVADLSLTDMGKFMSGKIVQVRPSISTLYENLNGQAAPKDLETLFELIHVYFTDLNKDAVAYNSFMSKQKSFLGNLMANPQFFFQDQVGRIKNEGNNRYLGFPTPEAMDKQDYDLAYAKYQERFADAGDFHFYFVGNVDNDKIKELAIKYIASLPATNSNEQWKETTFREKDVYQKEVIRRGTDPKSLVTITWSEVAPYDETEAKAVAALGEVLTIKLIEKLREEEGGVYGAGARGNFRKLSFSEVDFSISFPCGPENVDKLVAASLEEVEKIKANGPSAEDMAKVKETYLVSRKEAVKTNRFWLSTLVELDQQDKKVSDVLDYEKDVKAITAQQVQDVANKYLDENYFLGILLPEEK